MYESLNYAKRKYSNEATDEWDSAVEGVVKHSYPPKLVWFFPHGLRAAQDHSDATLHASNQKEQ